MATTQERLARFPATRKKMFPGQTEATVSPQRKAFPQLFALTEEVVLGEVWSRPGLDINSRSFCTMSVLTALGRTEELKVHMGVALDLGITKDQLEEMLVHLTVYCGYPAVMMASRVAVEVLRERGLVS